jgi:hypothetical protein
MAIILELPLFDCIIIINSVAVAMYEERIYIGLSCYPILFSTFLNKIRLNYRVGLCYRQTEIKGILCSKEKYGI